MALTDRMRALLSRADQRLMHVQEDLPGRRVTLRAEGHRPFTDADYDDAWLGRLIASSSSFFDLGCSVGAFTVLAALDPRRRIVALDANSRALQVCAMNLVANGLSDRVTLLLGFLGAEATGTWSPERRLVDPTFAPHAGLDVPRRTIDGIVEETGLAPDLVKLDIEGGEASALAGAHATAASARPRFFVEMHAVPGLTMADNGAAVLAWAAEMGYDAWYLTEHAKVTGAAAFADRGRCHLLLLPAGSAYPDGLADLSQGTPLAAVPEIPLSP
jgi:FkbM family methyltransferase